MLAFLVLVVVDDGVDGDLDRGRGEPSSKSPMLTQK